MNFSVKPTVPIYIINPQNGSCLFGLFMKVSQADTASNIASRIAKQNKHIKGI